MISATMNNNPDISICMVFYNAELYIKEAIDSTLKQSFENFEFIIVSDGSTDCSGDIVKSYTDSRIKYFKNKHDYIDSLNKAQVHDKNRFYLSNCLKGKSFITAGQSEAATCGKRHPTTSA
jgi:glycosyltransferase involved in cell wall biosynthesis